MNWLQVRLALKACFSPSNRSIMKAHKSVKVDCSILGGGIAGLWLLNRLKAKGYKAILLENQALGGTQTLASQGIIHGGVKYSLRTIGISKATQSIAAMPERWHNMLAGTPAANDPDLSAYQLISSPEYNLWIRNALPRLTGFFAERKLHSRLTLLNQNHKQKGRLYRLNGEFVVDIPKLVRALATPHQTEIFSINKMQMTWVKTQSGDYHLDLSGEDTATNYRISAKQFITTAGVGTQAILQQTELTDRLAMQRRPLHMIMAKHPVPADHTSTNQIFIDQTFMHQTFTHIVGWSDKPLMTITSHMLPSGNCVWYIGGNIGEQGVVMEKLDLLQNAKKCLISYFPRINWNKVSWDTLRIDRAEPQNKTTKTGHTRPDHPYCQQLANLMVCWPTKLTLVPMLADQVIAKLEKHFSPAGTMKNQSLATNPLLNLPKPAFGLPPWEKVAWTDVNL